MNEDRERARREVLDWLAGTGSTVVLVVLAALIVMFVLIGAGLV
jgi:succinate dehydrogenase hydrophobic anchor subunit